MSKFDLKSYKKTVYRVNLPDPKVSLYLKERDIHFYDQDEVDIKEFPEIKRYTFEQDFLDLSWFNWERVVIFNEGQPHEIIGKIEIVEGETVRIRHSYCTTVSRNISELQTITIL